MKLGTFGSNTLKPGASRCGMGWHVDYPYQDIDINLWPSEFPYGVQCLISLTDFRFDNGGTIFQPKSHNLKIIPEYANTINDTTECKYLECPRGSVLLAHSAWWHRQSINTSNNKRHALLANYILPHIIPKSDMANQFRLLRENQNLVRKMNKRDLRVLERLFLGHERRSSSLQEFQFGGDKDDIYSKIKSSFNKSTV